MALTKIPFQEQTINASYSGTSTISADTYTDVTGSSITLGVGVWDVIFDGTVSLYNASGASRTVYGNVAIFSSTNVLQDGAVTLLGGNLPSLSTLSTHVHMKARITVTSGTFTVKLRIRCSDASVNGYISISAPLSDYTAALGNPDINAKFYAKRVG